LTEAEARADIERMTAFSAEPALTTAEVGRLVALAKRVDAAGLKPGTVGWTPTWDRYASVAEGWRWKAAKVAGQFSFSADGGRIDKAEIRRACLEMAQHYSARRYGSPQLGLRSETV